jgi:co-chaperonin GroES (HSP10)
MQITTEDILSAKVPAGKILIELIEVENAKRGGIYIPGKANLRDGIIRKIGNQIDNTYYNLHLDKRVPNTFNIGDYVYLNFVSDFYRFVIEGKTYVVINPSTIIGLYNKDYYTNEILNAKN